MNANEKLEMFVWKLKDDQKYYMNELKSLTDKGVLLSKKERDYMNQLMDYIGYMNNVMSIAQSNIDSEKRWASY